MMVCSSVKACSNGVLRVGRFVYGEAGNIGPPGSSSTACFRVLSSPKRLYVDLNVSSSPLATGCRERQGCCIGCGFAKHKSMLRSVTANCSGVRPHRRHFSFSMGNKSANLKLMLPRQGDFSKIKCNVGLPRLTRDCTSGGLLLGLVVCCSSSDPVHAEANDSKGNDDESSGVKFAHGKRVYTDYTITGIPGDGRCLFRSVVHGACRRMGKPAPIENLQRELADELRERVADEFIKRREETEWFVEGDFDTYVSRMRKPHVWGGEPELFMASHVLRMPISVYMYDKDAGGLICIAEYGEEYGKDNPVRVLYHGFGHYEALQIPGVGCNRSKL